MSITNQGALRVSASAGSGKTYTLSLLYIKKALQSPDAFKGIVAITFTNKAAAELKERILKNLYELSLGTGDKKVEDLAKNLGYTNLQEVAEKARNTLSAVIHDMDSFQITTIDSFFQRIFSGIAYEIKLPQGIQPDLDQTLIKAEVLEMGIRDMDKETMKILLENVMDLLTEKGKGWRTAKYLETDLLENLFHDEVIDFQLKANPEELSGEKINAAKEKLISYADHLESTIRKAAQFVVNKCQELGFGENNLDPEIDSTFLAEIQKIKDVASGKIPPVVPSKTQTEGSFYRKPKSKLFSETDKQLIEQALYSYTGEASPQNLANIQLARAFARHLSAIRLLIYFREKLKERNQQAQRYLLQEVKFILKHLIADSDVPYIFEKLGTRIHSLMVDEFQDTDQTQWKVLLPLARAILDKGGFFAVVGDVKQSIYSWRGGDSTLFKSGVEKDLSPIPISEETLEYNYRSEPRIVHFNNWLFGQLPERLFAGIERAEMAQPSPEWGELFQKNYDKHAQKTPTNPPEKDQDGFIEIRLRERNATSENEDGDEESVGRFSWIVPEIIRLQDAGIPADDIAILARKNDHLKDIISQLDHAPQSFPDYDFRFSSAADIKNGEHPLMKFLFLALVGIEKPDNFNLCQMESLAASLGLTSDFHMTDSGKPGPWRTKWEEAQNLERLQSLNLSDRLHACISFFELADVPSQSHALISFKNLIFKYLKEEAVRYPDFEEWWQKKASNEKLSLPDQKSGIQLLTIHKSKGLDFGVVILAIESTSASDKWFDFPFWSHSESAPWNAFPLMKSKGKKEFINSDLGESFSNKIYANVLESLNTWYVAFTRPRYGLIVDISMGGDWKPKGDPVGRWAKMAFLVPNLLVDNKTELESNFTDSQLVLDAENLFLKFSYGQIKCPKKDKSPEHPPQPSVYFQNENVAEIPWSKEKDSSRESRIGDMTHKVLEKLKSGEDWEPVFQKMAQRHPAEIADHLAVQNNLESLFSDSRVKIWFSEKYRSYSEQELKGADNEILRVDRVLISEKEAIILDFKTGVPLPKHKEQVLKYSQILSQSIGQQTKGILIYTHPLEIVEVNLN